VLGAAAVAAVAAACGEDFEEGEGGGGASADVPCNEDPWICTPPQSCWVFTDYTFQCINVGGTPAGGSCTATLGSSQCVAGNICYPTSDSANGICVPLCDPRDPARACSSGTCSNVQFRRDDNQELLPGIWVCAPV
jgi:hypothetical protein